MPSLGASPVDDGVPTSRRRRLHKIRAAAAAAQFSTVDELMELNARLVSGGGVDDDDGKAKVERLVQWPPSQLLNLARKTVVFGGDPAAVLSELSPTRYPVGLLTFCNPTLCSRACISPVFISQVMNGLWCVCNRCRMWKTPLPSAAI